LGKYMQMERTAIGKIKYDAKDPYNSYDNQGNYYLNYDKTITVSLEDADWRVRRDAQQLVINPVSLLVSVPRSLPARVEIFPAGHQDPANVYYRYVLPLGRGYSQLIDTITSVTLDEAGIATAKATGKLFSPYPGQWTLEIDTQNDFLVRKASFVRNGNTAPGWTCQSVGIYEAPIPLLAEGVASLAEDYMIKVNLRRYSSDCDGSFAAALRDKVRRKELLPSGSLMLDFKSIDNDGMPFRSYIASGQ